MTDYRTAAVEEALRQGVDPHLILRQMGAESAGNPGAVSSKGARGLMQLMPATAAELGVDPSDPAENLRGGVTYMKQQLDRFGDPRLAAAAYNAGPGAVQRYGGVPPYAETQGYVQKVAGGPVNDPGFDTDVFGDPAPADAAPAPGSEIRRNANGEIEIDINQSTNPDFLAGRDPGYDADVFGEAAPEPIAPVAPPPQISESLRLAREGAAQRQADRPKMLGEGFAHSLTAPFNDEVAGGLAYLTQGGINLGRKAFGAPIKIRAADAASAEIDQTRADQAAYDAAHPKRGFAGRVLGGLMASPVAGAGAIPALAATAATGAAYGAGDAKGGFAPRAGGAALGAALGLATHGAVAGSIKGVGAVRSAIADRAPRIAMPDGTAAPAPSATNRAAGYLERLGRSAPRITPAPGKSLTAAESLGAPGETALAALTRRPGKTSELAQTQLGARQVERSARVLDDFELQSGIKPEAAQGDIDALVARQQKEVSPLFDLALKGNPGPIMNAKLSELGARPVVKRAMSTVVDDLQNAGRDPAALGLSVQVGPDGQLMQVQLKAPTAEAWDLVRKAIGRQVERNPVTGKVLPDSQSQGNYGVRTATRDLTVALKETLPGYDAALAKSADYLSANEAFDAGAKLFLNPRVTETQFAKRLADLSEGERDAFKGGIAAELYNKAQNGLLSQRFLKLPRIRAKLNAALGEGEAGRFIQGLEAEARMASAENRILAPNGSQTAPLKSAMDDQDAIGPGLEFATDFAKSAATGQGIRGSAVSAVGKQLGKSVDAFRTRGLGVEGRDEAGRLLLGSPEDLDAFIKAAIAPKRQRPVGLFGSGSSALHERSAP